MEPLTGDDLHLWGLLAHTVLAIILTFAPLGHYPAYISPADPYGILPFFRGDWGLTPLADQQWGGLMMWVPACLVYLSFILATLARWYRLPESDAAIPAAVALAEKVEVAGSCHNAGGLLKDVLGVSC